MTPSLYGWEAFSKPRALTHTRITWALSPMAPQVPSVTPGSPLCPWYCGHSSWRGVQQHTYTLGYPYILCAGLYAPLLVVQSTQHLLSNIHIFTNNLNIIYPFHNHLHKLSSQHDHPNKLMIAKIIYHIKESPHHITIQEVCAHFYILWN